jgi:hypothetical protein
LHLGCDVHVLVRMVERQLALRHFWFDSEPLLSRVLRVDRKDWLGIVVHEVLLP